MSERQETIADIITDLKSDKRRFSNSVGMAVASRLEAALKREKAEIESKALEPGGIVEAERQKAVLSKQAGKDNTGEAVIKSETNGNFAAMREALRAVKIHLDGYIVNMRELRKAVDAALSAPPRNCERFQTTERAKEAYFAEVRHVSVWDGCETERLVDWLLATATKKEGGNDGR